MPHKTTLALGIVKSRGILGATAITKGGEKLALYPTEGDILTRSVAASPGPTVDSKVHILLCQHN